jgi:hypothetical protein
MWTAAKFLLTSSFALFWLQNAPNPAETAKAATSSSAKVTLSPAQPVITVRGVCDAGKKQNTMDASSCTTVVTKEQFERLAQALHPGEELSANARNNLGKVYAEYIAIEAAAHQAGMEDTDEFREFMNWMRVLAATEYYRRKLQQKYSAPSQEEIDAYYREHLPDYETVKLARVLIPRESTSTINQDEFEKKALEVANTAEAGLVTGLDPTAIQKNAYATLGLAGAPPVDIGKRRRKDFIPDEAPEVFSLKPGEVSKVYPEPKNYVIYKLLSRDTPSEENIKQAISGQIMEQKFRDTMKSLLDSAPAELNQQYFGSSGPAANEPLRSPHTFVAH